MSEPSAGSKWFSSPVTAHAGSIAEIRRHIPDFERRTFELAQGDQPHRANRRLDTVVRLPTPSDPACVPVGVVSKEYVLVAHAEVLDAAIGALTGEGVDLKDVGGELRLSDCGERMWLSLCLPERHQFDPGDGHPMALRLECWNSVEGSTRFRAVMGWLRFVCSNGLVIGVTRSDIHRRHVMGLQLKEIAAVLSQGLKDATADIQRFQRWRRQHVSPQDLSGWVNEAVLDTWGFKAAARTFHIAQGGLDVQVVGSPKYAFPSEVEVRRTSPVPGAPSQSRNVFDVSQILAWLAKERRDVQEQLEWREQIPALVTSLEASLN